MIKKWSIRYPAVGGEEERRAYVYLPTMYEADPDRRYPVLYMFDGQNVFFDEDATYGKSWGVADYLDYTDTPLIVAAVDFYPRPPRGGRQQKQRQNLYFLINYTTFCTNLEEP